MAKYQKTGTVDGYAALKAAARAAPGVHVSHTALPAKRVIECYKCGYTFQQHGKTATTTCSKCRHVLDLTDHTLERDCNETLQTCGVITIPNQVTINGGNLIGNDVRFEGTLRAGTLRALRRLELGAGASFPENLVTARDLKILRDAVIVFEQPAEFRDVEIAGVMRGRLRATGTVTIQPGAEFAGDLTAAHLIVADGGGLNATVRLCSGGL